MNRRHFNRMPRLRPPIPREEVKIPKPPAINEPRNFPWLLTLLPLAGVFFMVAIYGFVYQNWLLALPMVAMSGFSALSSIIGRRMQRENQQEKIEEDEKRYTEALRQKREKLEALRKKQREIRLETDPGLPVLMSRARQAGKKLWERRPDDDDFLSLRLGIGDLPSTVKVSAPHPDMPDPRLERAHEIEREYQQVPDVPVKSDLRLGPLGVAGPLQQRSAVARSLVCNLVVHHSPDEVHLLGLYPNHRVHDWHWLKWLAHTHALADPPKPYIASDPASAERVLKELLNELHRRKNQMYGMRHEKTEPDWPWLVLVVEDYNFVRDHSAIHLLLSSEARELNATAIFLVDAPQDVPMGCHAISEVQPGGVLRYSIARVAGEPLCCSPDSADADLSEQLARSLAPLEVYSLQSDTAIPTHVRLLKQLGIRDINEYQVEDEWGKRFLDQDALKEYLKKEYLKVPIGERRGEQPMVLDLNHTGHGPHGLIAGTTGSGKSELVQTLVVALALKHHPHDVGFVLVDFKGGGTFSVLKDLPHTLGMVTDLSGNLTERALVALEAEMDRRKEMFNQANVNDIARYQQLYWKKKVDEPLPRLIVIIDEFAELVNDYPDFMDGLIGIARVGRSLGVHLILATQSPAGVVKQQIWANAKFRICLRVEARQESQEMLRRPEAADLPRIPGRGYLQVGNNDVFELFQVARVAGPYRRGGDTDSLLRREKNRAYIAWVLPTGERKVLFDSNDVKKSQEDQTSVRTDIDVVVDRLSEAARQMGIEALPSPWPEPLPEHILLPRLLCDGEYVGWNGGGWDFERPAFRFCRECGMPMRRCAKFCYECGTSMMDTCGHCGGELRPGAQYCNTCGNEIASSGDASHRPWLGAVLGMLDDPAHQRQLPLSLKLNQQDGHLIVVGSPGSGKEMLLRTLVTSLAHTHVPEELQFYLIEFGGQAFKVLEDLPHVGGIFTQFHREQIQRLLILLLDALEERKMKCARAGVDGLLRLRKVRPDDAPAAIVVVITGFMEFRTSFHDQLIQLTRLIREGGPFGIHVILVGDRAGDFPTTVSSVIVRRFALHLAEADEYGIVLGTRLRVDKDQRVPPGRGWYGRPPLEFQTASPGYEEDENAQIDELKAMARSMDQSWTGERPKEVQALPEEIVIDEVLDAMEQAWEPGTQRQLKVPVGLDGVRMQPLFVDLVQDGPDFIVGSTPQGGKTTLLLTWLLMLAEVNSPQQVQFVIVSGRRDSLKALRGLPHVLDYCKDADVFCEAEGVLARLLDEIERRDELLSNNGHAYVDMFPHILVVFDDYDEFSGFVENDVKRRDKLLVLARQGQHVDMHTIVTGPLSDLGRDPLVRQLRVGRSGFLLRVLDANVSNPLGMRPRSSDMEMQAGRGYVVRNGLEETLQVATPGKDEAAAIDRRTRIARHWEDQDAEPAQWPEVAKPAPETREEEAG